MRRVLLPPISVTDPKPWVHGTHKPVRIVLHDTESHDTAGVAEIRGVFNFWHTQKNPDGTLAKYGAHFVVDRNGNVGRGGDPTQIQWHVTNLNTGSIGIEQIGFATFRNLVWRRKRRKQLYAVARIIAWAHGRYGIPIRVRHDPRLPGVTTHRRVGLAGIDPSGHTDPGPHYPLGFVIFLAKMIQRIGFKLDRRRHTRILTSILQHLRIRGRRPAITT